jgi:CheY-like chemotaxis protein
MERTRTKATATRRPRGRQAAPSLLADPGGESAVLDKNGTIVAVNHAWRAFADQSGYRGRDHGVGTNYLAVCERAAAQSEEAASTAKALGEVMAGRRRGFRLEYPCISVEGPRWFQLRITRPQGREVERIVVAHEDITEVKRAQEELTAVTARLMQVQDEERRSIARELHDTTAQNLLDGAAKVGVGLSGTGWGRRAVTLRILLADDHDVVRRGLKELLEEQVGWKVCAEAANGRQAVELAIETRPQVAVLDFSMPELNGLEATRRIRQAVPETEVLSSRCMRARS